MNSSNWVEDLSKGHQYIDGDHQIYFFHLQKILNRIEAKESVARIADQIRVFIQFAKYHCMNEELLMKESNFLGLPGHKAVHADFIVRVESKLQQFESGACPADKLLGFLQSWHTSHGANEDWEFAQYLSMVQFESPAQRSQTARSEHG